MPATANVRVDERMRFVKIKTVDGVEYEGDFWMDISHGGLQAAQYIFVMDGQQFFPITSIIGLWTAEQVNL